MATIGHLSAVVESFGMKFTGVIGYTMWAFVHVLYVVGWGNRIGTILNWTRAMTFTKNRLHRNITFERAQFEVAEEPVSPRPHPDGQEKHKGSPGLSGIS
jgi:NADH dehydrogenase